MICGDMQVFLLGILPLISQNDYLCKLMYFITISIRFYGVHNGKEKKNYISCKFNNKQIKNTWCNMITEQFIIIITNKAGYNMIIT